MQELLRPVWPFGGTIIAGIIFYLGLRRGRSLVAVQQSTSRATNPIGFWLEQASIAILGLIFAFFGVMGLIFGYR
jgi:hypothetical protein